MTAKCFLHSNSPKDCLHVLCFAIFQQLFKGPLHGRTKQNIFCGHCSDCRAEKALSPLDGAEKAHNEIRCSCIDVNIISGHFQGRLFD